MSLTGRVLLRQLAADRWAALLVAVLVAGTAALAAGAVRGVDAVAVAGLKQAVDRAGPSARALTGSAQLPPPAGPPTAPDQPYLDLVRQTEDGPGRDLAGLVDRPDWSLTTPVFRVGPEPRPGPLRKLAVRVASGWQQRVRLSAGRMPAGGEPARPDAGTRLPGGPVDRPTRVEVVVSALAAELMALQVGDRLVVTPDTVGGISATELQVVGLVQPLDPADPFWELDPSALRPRLNQPPDGPQIRTGIAFAGTGALPAISDQLAGSSGSVSVRMALRSGPLSRRDPVGTIAALRRATARSMQVGVPTDPLQLSMTSTAPRVLLGHLAQRSPVLALVGLLLASLLGAAAVTLVLAGRLLVDRRRQALALAMARGGSTRQLLGLLAAEGLLLGVPAAAAGYALAALLPGRPGVAPWLAGLVASAPALVLPAAAWSVLRATGRSAVARSPRRDLVLRRGRLAGLALLVGVAVAAVLALRGRGLAAAGGPVGGIDPVTGQGGAGDPLVALAPLLVAGTLAVLTARVVGRPLAAAARWAGRRSGAVGFLGLARSAREGALGALGLAALVLGLSVAVLVAVIGSTLAAATVEAAQREVAADLRVGGTGFVDAQVDALARVPGVAAVTPLLDAGDVALGTPRDLAASEQAALWAGDAAGLAEVQRGLPGAGRWPRELLEGAASGSGDRLPAAVSPGTAAVGEQIYLRVGGRRVEATVVAVRPAFPGASQTGRWVFLPLAGLRSTTGLTFAADALLARVDRMPSADRVRRALGPDLVTSVRSADGLVRENGGSPLVAAVRGGLPLALLVGGLYAGIAVLLTVLVGSRDRGRFLAHLRALGLSPGQSGSLVGLEVVPVVTVALLVGVLAGGVMAVLVVPVADLRPLSGAELAVPVRAAAGPLIAVCGGFAAVLGLAVLVAVATGRRVSPAAARAGDVS